MQPSPLLGPHLRSAFITISRTLRAASTSTRKEATQPRQPPNPYRGRPAPGSKPPDSASPSSRAAPKNPKQRLGYSSVARRYTAAMVAAPIAIVTSYHLFQRLVMGAEQKHLGEHAPEASVGTSLPDANASPPPSSSPGSTVA